MNARCPMPDVSTYLRQHNYIGGGHVSLEQNCKRGVVTNYVISGSFSGAGAVRVSSDKEAIECARTCNLRPMPNIHTHRNLSLFQCYSSLMVSQCRPHPQRVRNEYVAIVMQSDQENRCIYACIPEPGCAKPVLDGSAVWH